MESNICNPIQIISKISKVVTRPGLFILFISNGVSQNSEFNPDDARWDDIFKLAGFDGDVEAIAIAPNGNIYVGGHFDLINGIRVSGIAMWDGEAWNPLGTGLVGGWV